jgi:hypothetical protein
VTVTDPTTTSAGALMMIGLSAQNGTAPGPRPRLWRANRTCSWATAARLHP